MESENADIMRQDNGMGVGKILGLLPMFLLFAIIILRVSWVLYKSTRGQKTRSAQQRRMYTGTRTRQLSMPGEPTIFVSPANLPPPPKYEAMAPPSYDEVMGIQYPGYQGQQPITQPITHAMAQGSSNPDIPAVHTGINATNNNNARSSELVEPPATVTITNEERRPSAVAVRA